MQSTDSNEVTTKELKDIKPIHCKMARAALGLGVRDLARIARVSPNTVSRFERGDEVFGSTMFMLKAALEEAGIEFIYENGGGPGVRLKRRKPPVIRDNTPEEEAEIQRAIEEDPDTWPIG